MYESTYKVLVKHTDQSEVSGCPKISKLPIVGEKRVRVI